MTRRWRVPGRRIWRAFAELDPYSDEQCRRFMKVACRRSRWRHLHRVLVGSGFLFLALLAIALLGWWFVVDRPVGQSVARFDSWPMGAVAAVVAPVAAVPLLGTLLVRDALLRRRLRDVLRGTGSCPACRYSLVGLAVPASLELPCPECGFLCRVDLALSELAHDASGHPVGRTIVFARAPFWTRERRRRWIHRGLIVTGAIVLVLGTPVAVNEWRIRRQASIANASRPTQQEVTKTIERLRPGLELVAEPSAIRRIEEIAARLREIQAEVEPLAFSTGGPTGRLFVDMSLVLPDDPSLAARVGGGSGARSRFDPVGGPTEAELADLAGRMLDAYERAGIMDDVDEVTATPIQVRDPRLPPEQLWSVQLTYLGCAREIARLLGARMLVAARRGDAAEAGRSLEALLAIAAHLDGQPYLIEHMVGSAIRALAEGKLLRWLASNPGEDDLDAMERALRSNGGSHDLELGIEIELLMMREYSGRFFGTPSNVRLAALVPALAVQIARSQIGSVGGTGPSTIGTWKANDDAMQAWRAFALATIGKELHERGGGASTMAPATPPKTGGVSLRGS